MADINDLLKSSRAQKILSAQKPRKRRPWTVMISDDTANETTSSQAESPAPLHDAPKSDATDSRDNGKQTVSKREANSKQTVSKREANPREHHTSDYLNGKQTVSKREADEPLEQGGPALDSPIAVDLSSNHVSEQINGKQTVSKREARFPQDLHADSVNGKQTVSEREANGKQEEKQETEVPRAVVQRDSETSLLLKKREAQREAISKQSVSKPEAIGKQNPTTFDCNQIADLDLRLLLFAFEQCLKIGARKTPPLRKNDFAEGVGTTAKTVKTQTHRLLAKGYLQKGLSKPGRGGWAIFILPDDVYEKLYIYHSQQQRDFDKREANGKQTVSKWEAQREAQREADVSSSSYFKNKEELLLNSNLNASHTFENSVLSDDWESIDYEKISHIGFTKTHVRQIMQRKILSPLELQDSIDHFVYDIEKNNRLSHIRTHALTFFMGVVGRGKVYLAPGYESEADVVLREYIEQKKRTDQRKQVMLEELKQIEYSNWRARLGKEALLEILPEEPFCKYASPQYEASLRRYFEDNHWPAIRDEIPGLNT